MTVSIKGQEKIKTDGMGGVGSCFNALTTKKRDKSSIFKKLFSSTKKPPLSDLISKIYILLKAPGG